MSKQFQMTREKGASAEFLMSYAWYRYILKKCIYQEKVHNDTAKLHAAPMDVYRDVSGCSNKNEVKAFPGSLT